MRQTHLNARPTQADFAFADTPNVQSLGEFLADQIGLADAAAAIYGHELPLLAGHDLIKCSNLFLSANHLFPQSGDIMSKIRLSCQQYNFKVETSLVFQ